jgi:CMP/dCMP kinase
VVDLSGLVGVALGRSGSGMKELGWYRFPDSDTWAVKAPAGAGARGLRALDLGRAAPPDGGAVRRGVAGAGALPARADEPLAFSRVVIAIDGPAGAGKSTVARAVAARLGFTYLDTGAMYRAAALAGTADCAIDFDGDGRVLLDGRDVSGEIRTPEISERASQVASDPEVRRVLVARQRELLREGDWVAEGRDIALVVAPDAQVKVFLTADPRERARRRAADLGADEETVLREQAVRDERDQASGDRSVTEPAPGATVVDTTGLDFEEVVERIARMAR